MEKTLFELEMRRIAKKRKLLQDERELKEIIGDIKAESEQQARKRVEEIKKNIEKLQQELKGYK